MIDIDAEIAVLEPGDVLILRCRHKLTRDVREQLMQQLGNLRRKHEARVVLVDSDFDVIIHRKAEDG